MPANAIQPASSNTPPPPATRLACESASLPVAWTPTNEPHPKSARSAGVHAGLNEVTCTETGAR
ncbi:Uncharacterised protein [Mycobacteroides abscessus subsp. abscessus]|nr:Uncharacterised protein [Mycobacteroides abscessus subsp. abscessus]SHY55820.1 Uncharacterised protein [Mycobacteroides abscessus subsp. abscessus]